MDQVKIDVGKPQLVEAFLQRGPHSEKVAGPQFGRDENLFPGDAAFPDGTAHAGFVAVDLGGIDQTVAGFQRP